MAYVDLKCGYGSTPLHYAALHDRCEVASFLVEEGARVNAKDRKGKTPLKLASHNGCFAVARVLAKKLEDLKIFLSET